MASLLYCRCYLYHSHCSPVWRQQGEYMLNPVPLSLKPLHVRHLSQILNLWHGTSHIEHFKCSLTKLRRVKWWMDLCKIDVIHQQSTHKFMVLFNLSPLILLWSLTPFNQRFHILVVSQVCHDKINFYIFVILFPSSLICPNKVLHSLYC